MVAVGECGLDYHWPVPKDAQLAMFEAHIRLALELDKPIIVHDRNAHADVYACSKNTSKASSTAIPAVPMTRCGWQSRDCSSVLAGRVPSRVPSGRQRPSVPCRWKASCWRPTAPIWHRSRCAAPAGDSSLIRYVGEYIAQLRGISAEEVFRTTAENARRVYGL